MPQMINKTIYLMVMRTKMKKAKAKRPIILKQKMKEVMEMRELKTPIRRVMTERANQRKVIKWRWNQ